MSIFAQAIAPYQNDFSTIRGVSRNIFGLPTRAGITVNPHEALTISAYYDGVNLIANDIARSPFWVIQKDETNGTTKQPNHIVRQLLEWEANSSMWGGMSAFTFKKTMTIHMLNWGNAYAVIHRRGATIQELELIEPWNARILKNRETKDIFYKFKGYDRFHRHEEVLHLHQFSLDGIIGISIIDEYATDRMGGHIAAARYGEAFFGNGTHMGGILISEDSLGTDPDVVNEAKSEIRTELDNVYGGDDKWHRLGILDGKWEYKNMTLKASDAQLMERTEATVEDVARWLGVPISKLKSKQNQAYNTREHEAKDYVNGGLDPRIKIWKQETRRKLLTEPEKLQGFETDIDTRKITQGSLKDTAEAMRELVANTIYTPNQGLDLMGEDTFEGGNVHLMPLNYTTLEAFAQGGTQNDPAVENLIRSIREIANNKTNGHHASTDPF